MREWFPGKEQDQPVKALIPDRDAFGVVDNHDVERAFAVLQLQAELGFHSRKDRWTGRHIGRRCSLAFRRPA